jgi:hypothetical protein
VIQDEERQLRDVKPPIDIPYDYFLLFSVISAIILTGLLVYIGYRFYVKRKETGYFIKPPEPPRPAHEVALDALEHLIQKNLLADGLVKAFYSEISEITRRYIEGRYFIPALEETSREILKELSGQDMSDDMLQKAREVLEISDIAKFAKYKPSDDENKNVIEWTREFIEGTMVIFVPKPEPGISEELQTGDIETEEEKIEK